MPTFFRNMIEVENAFAKAGLNFKGIKTLRQASEVYKAAGKAPAKRQLTIRKPTTPAVVVDEIAGLKAAAKAATTATAKVDAYSKLTSSLRAKLKAEPAFAKQTAIRRDLMAAQKSEAHARLAERSADPKAASIRNLLNAADE